MPVNQLTFTQPQAYSGGADFSQLANLGNVYREAQDRETRLSALGGLTGDPATDAQILARSRDPQFALTGLKMVREQGQDTESKRQFDLNYKINQGNLGVAQGNLGIAKSGEARAQTKFEEDNPDFRREQIRKQYGDAAVNDPRWQPYIWRNDPVGSPYAASTEQRAADAEQRLKEQEQRAKVTFQRDTPQYRQNQVEQRYGADAVQNPRMQNYILNGGTVPVPERPGARYEIKPDDYGNTWRIDNFSGDVSKYDPDTGNWLPVQSPGRGAPGPQAGPPQAGPAGIPAPPAAPQPPTAGPQVAPQPAPLQLTPQAPAAAPPAPAPLPAPTAAPAVPPPAPPVVAPQPEPGPPNIPRPTVAPSPVVDDKPLNRKDPFVQTMLKNQADQLDDLRTKAERASQDEKTINRIEKIHKSAFTGPVMGRVGSYIPFLGDANRLLDSEVGKLALNDAQQLKGSFSDKDMKFIGTLPPSALMNEAAAKDAISARRATVERVKQQSRFFQEWRARKGDLRGADTSWQRYIDDNEITKEDKSQISGLSFNPNYNKDYSKYMYRKGQTGQGGVSFEEYFK